MHDTRNKWYHFGHVLATFSYYFRGWVGDACLFGFCDATSPCEDLLERGSFLSLSVYRIRFKCFHGLNAPYLDDIFTQLSLKYGLSDFWCLYQHKFRIFTVSPGKKRLTTWSELRKVYLSGVTANKAFLLICFANLSRFRYSITMTS